MDFLRRTFEQIKSGWSNLSGNQKFLYSGIAISLIIAITVTGIMLGSKNYVPLYNNLTATQSGSITQRLQEMAIQYKLSSDGTTILVPDDVVHQLRLDLATEMPAGGVVGFESFNETRFGETETDKRVRFLAALQGELTRTISRMTEVESAMVHLAIPETSVFISEDKPTKASVFLKLRSTSRMDADKVRSIIYFVANSVEGLDPENVTVIDEYGNLLSEGLVGSNSPFSVSTMTATQLDIKSRYEREIAKSIQNMLERVRGAGKAVVSVSADLDFDSVEISQETYGNSVLRSEQTSDSRSTGTTPGGGVAGTDSNLPGTTSFQETGGGESSSTQTEAIRNYEIDKTTELRGKAPGMITKLSVSVIVDGEITDEERVSLENVVASASGLDFERGDLINVVGMPFNTEAFESLQESIANELRNQQIRTYINYGLMVLGILGLIGLGFLLKRRSDRRPEVSLAGARIGDISSDFSIDSLEDLDPLTAEKAEIQRKVERLAKTQPEDVAKVIKSWLMEDMR